MAKAGLLFVGTDDGIVLYSEPGAMGRWLQVGHELRGAPVTSAWCWAENPLVVLAHAGGSLLRSEDGGASWAPVPGGPAGTLAGARAAQGFVACLRPDGALFRSLDAGTSWEQAGAIGAGGAGLLISAPDSPLRLYAAAGARIFASDDGGVSWAGYGALPGAAAGLAVQPGAQALLAVADGALLRHTGAGWEALGAAPALAGPLAILPGREPTLLAGLAAGGVGRSPDVGVSWEHPAAEGGLGTPPGALIAAPYHPDTAFAGAGAALALSTDRGRTWQRLRGELPGIRAIAAARLI